MNFIDDIPAMNNALMAYAINHSGELPEATRTRFIELSSNLSPVDRFVKCGELLYANRATLSAEGKTVCAQLIALCANNGWHGLAEDARGAKMVAALRRDLGEPAPIGGNWPAPESDPAAKEEYKPAPVVTDTPPPAPAA